MTKPKKTKVTLTPKQVMAAKYATVTTLQLAAKASRPQDLPRYFTDAQNTQFESRIGNGDSVTVWDHMNNYDIHFEKVELDDVSGFYLVEWDDVNGIVEIS